MSILANIFNFVGLRIWFAIHGYVKFCPEVFIKLVSDILDMMNKIYTVVLDIIVAVTSPIWISVKIWGDEILLELLKRRILKPIYDQRPILGEKRLEWELVAATRSTNNGYNSFEFYPAYISDPTASLDDRFAPDNISVVYNIEIRRRSMYMQEVIVWRVSMLSGVQKSKHSFNVFWKSDEPFANRYEAGKVKCYESNGVVVITCPQMESANFLVYDSRTGKSAVFDYFRETNSSHLVFEVSGIVRLSGGGDGVFEGWSMRVLEASRVKVNHGFRAVVTESIVLFQPRQQPAAMVTQEKRIRFIDFVSDDVSFRQIHTSGGEFGVYAMGYPMALLYDGRKRQFIYFATIDELVEFAPSLIAYDYCANGDLPHLHFCPIVASQRECIYGFQRGVFYRRSFAVESLIYITMKRLFREQPEMRQI